MTLRYDVLSDRNAYRLIETFYKDSDITEALKQQKQELLKQELSESQLQPILPRNLIPVNRSKVLFDLYYKN